MEVLINLLKRFQKLDYNKLMATLLRDAEFVEFILDLNRINQLYNAGVDANGVSLGEYSPYTIGIKIQKGQPDDRITLFDTGEFYRSFILTINLDGFTIDADPIKDDTNLFTEFGEDILGLTDESKDLLVSQINQIIIPAIEEYLFSA